MDTMDTRGGKMVQALSAGRRRSKDAIRALELQAEWVVPRTSVAQKLYMYVGEGISSEPCEIPF